MNISYERRYSSAKTRKFEVFWNYATDSATCRGVWGSAQIEGYKGPIAFTAEQYPEVQQPPVLHARVTSNDFRDARVLRCNYQVNGTYHWPKLSGRLQTTPMLLPEKDHEAYVIARRRMDFKEIGFPEFLDRSQLKIRTDESTFAFAKRVYDWMDVNVKYDSKEPYPTSALQVAIQRRGECGRQGELVATVLRANGIPVRVFFGGVVQASGNQGTHVWGDFFDPLRGWIPIDTAGKCFANHSYLRVPFPGSGEPHEGHKFKVDLEKGRFISGNPVYTPIVRTDEREKPIFEQTSFTIKFK